jgi:hypothetical protein
MDVQGPKSYRLRSIANWIGWFIWLGLALQDWAINIINWG